MCKRYVVLLLFAQNPHKIPLITAVYIEIICTHKFIMYIHVIMLMLTDVMFMLMMYFSLFCNSEIES